MQPDPLSQLDEWAVETERRVRREYRWQRLRRLPRLPRRPGKRRDGRYARRLLASLVVIGLLGAFWTYRDRIPQWTELVAEPYPTVTHPAGAYATSGATTGPAGAFDGTPAATYPRGAAGFALPPARPTGRWTRAQVAAALAKVRAALVAVYLDRRVIVDGNLAPLLKQLTPDARADFRSLSEKSRRALAVRISGLVRLAAEQPRVSGRTTVRVGTDENGDSCLEIVTNYVVVYAFDVPDKGQSSRVAGVHRQITWRAYREETRARDWGLWGGGGAGYAFNMDCSEARKGLLAPVLGNLPAGVTAAPEEPTEEWTEEHLNGLYDPNRSLDVGPGCGARTPTPSPSHAPTVAPDPGGLTVGRTTPVGPSRLA